MSQEIEYIKLADLVLWTENPRDPIDEKAADQDIVDRAILDKSAKWSLRKLAKEMGDYYDFSELPTVVYHKSRPVVYDGNRRIILGKIKHGLVDIGDEKTIDIPDFPESIPCNVCSEEIALNNVYRKHAESGSWDPLERDVFFHKFMGKEKSPFLLFDENTNGLISINPKMNQGFVKKEVLSEHKLEELGFIFEGEQMLTRHSKEEAELIINDIVSKIESKILSTRGDYRGDVVGVLDERSRRIVGNNSTHTYKAIEISILPVCDDENEKKASARRTKRVKSKGLVLFGGDLYLKAGDINNLYRDICSLHEFYLKNKSKLSPLFPALIRMSLRLLCESASKECNYVKIDDYIKANYKSAKKGLEQDIKTLLSELNITENSLCALLQSGAHGYTATRIYETAVGISVILGAMLNITHAKQ